MDASLPEQQLQKQQPNGSQNQMLILSAKTSVRTPVDLTCDSHLYFLEISATQFILALLMVYLWL